MKRDILAINPGSTSTKFAVFRDSKPLFEENIGHDPLKLAEMGGIFEQLSFREEIILGAIKKHDYDLNQLAATVGRGGMLIGLLGGGYRVTPALCQAMKSPENPPHAANLGAQLAYDIAQPLGIPAFIYDSTMGCELSEIAKITGLEGIERYGCCHVLNSRAKAIEYAESIGKDYKTMNLIVCHMGGGISITAHSNGKIIDDSTYDNGPMAPDRTGGIPLILWTKLCFSGKYTKEEVNKLISGKGGLMSYLGVTDCRKVEEMIAHGNKKAAVVYAAMAYQIAKGIAEMSVALQGNVEGIILTGGAARSEVLTGLVQDYAAHIGNFIVMPGEKELFALASGAERILKGEEIERVY